MSDKIVKKINIGEDSRYIGAKYDINGQEIINTYINVANGITKEDWKKGYVEIEGDEGTYNHYIVSSDVWVSQAQANNAETGFIKKNEAESYIADTITNLIQTGKVEVEVPQTKKFSFETAGTNFVISAEEGYKQILKVFVYQSNFSSTSEQGRIALDQTATMQLDSSFFLPGASFEIYKTVLICTNNLGDRRVLTTANPTDGS